MLGSAYLCLCLHESYYRHYRATLLFVTVVQHAKLEGLNLKECDFNHNFTHKDDFLYKRSHTKGCCLEV